MRKIMVCLFAIAVLLVGCGQNKPEQQGGTHGAQSSNKETVQVPLFTISLTTFTENLKNNSEITEVKVEKDNLLKFELMGTNVEIVIMITDSSSNKFSNVNIINRADDKQHLVAFEIVMKALGISADASALEQTENQTIEIEGAVITIYRDAEETTIIVSAT